MSTECSFDFLETKDVEVRFNWGQISIDAGISVFIEWMTNESLIDPFAQVLETSDE